ncbi:MAG: SUMF1/EgtB/PvdO family nonheme iron enzyme [Caldilineaceae bacterium]|nr:SUMF1/EgtB/PvdO family nonheme iron enzyme [Caldilineaceae bacterium]
MSRFQIIPFGGRKEAPSNADQKPGRFQLSRTKGKSSQLEWEFGQEPNELFQLRAPVDAPTDGHPTTPTNRPQSALRTGNGANPFAPKQDNRWRRPAVEGEVLAPDPPQNSTQHSPTTPISPDHAIYSGASTHSTAGSAVTNRAVSIDDAYGQPPQLAPENRGRSNGYSHGNGYHPQTNGWHPQREAHLDNSHQQRSRKPVTARSQLAALFTGEEGMRRVLTTRLALDDALDRWWTHSELAPLSLLRDGLLVLEAGHDLDETQRSFLLRTALRTGRGMITALHYQLDADRTAFLIKEALLDAKHSLDPDLINYLRKEDEQSIEWADYLEHDLAYEANVASGKRSELAAAALRAMQQPASTMPDMPDRATVTSPKSPPLPNLLASLRPAAGPSKQGSHAPTMSTSQLLPLSHRWSLRWLLWACLTVLLLLSYGWPQLRVTSAMIEIPAGTYLVSDPTSSSPATSGRFQTVTLPAYRIDQQEVSNAAYRRCWEQDSCPIPSSFDSRTRPGYFANRAYDAFPVVNVDWSAADSYCTWVGKRLPTLDEWEVAASLAPATGRRFIYPWGDRFDVRLVNGGGAEIGDTQSSGTYHPAGSTSSGLMDMAGNVAEWTSMPAASMVDGFVVKGGSYQDDPTQLRNDALVELQRESSLPWLGFRCVADE